jgi:SAM-dependent methyltransferase
MPASMTWEQAVDWLRGQPDQQALVRACYYDDPLIEAARRFAASEEWVALRGWLPRRPGAALDLGAGRGIGSYALAADGWRVTAIEPDPGATVGAGAIRALAGEASLPITVVEGVGEALPFPGRTFRLVYGRQLLHHARDLALLCQEAARVLQPGGRFVAVREHVLSAPGEIGRFLQAHPLHRLYGGEYAYTLREYIDAIKGAGLRLCHVLGPFDTPVNYFPMTRDYWVTVLRSALARRLGRRLAATLVNETHTPGRMLLGLLARVRSRRDRTPGRLYSFIAERPLTWEAR